MQNGEDSVQVVTPADQTIANPAAFTAEITNDDKVLTLTENQSFYIPPGRGAQLDQPRQDPAGNHRTVIGQLLGRR